MSTDRQTYEVSLYSQNFNAEAEVRVQAYDEAHAIRLACQCMSSDFSPQVLHIQLKDN